MSSTIQKTHAGIVGDSNRPSNWWMVQGRRLCARDRHKCSWPLCRCVRNCWVYWFRNRAIDKSILHHLLENDQNDEAQRPNRRNTESIYSTSIHGCVTLKPQAHKSSIVVIIIICSYSSFWVFTGPSVWFFLDATQPTEPTKYTGILNRQSNHLAKQQTSAAPTTIYYQVGQLVIQFIIIKRCARYNESKAGATNQLIGRLVTIYVCARGVGLGDMTANAW